MTGGIIEIDVHGKNTEEAKKAINMQIHSAGKSIYRIRVIHGYNGGTRVWGLRPVEVPVTAARGFGACSVRNTVTEGSRR